MKDQQNNKTTKTNKKVNHQPAKQRNKQKQTRE